MAAKGFFMLGLMNGSAAVVNTETDGTNIKKIIVVSGRDTTLRIVSKITKIKSHADFANYADNDANSIAQMYSSKTR